jgi:light-harvesting protein B-800-850 alpha chain
MNNSKMWLVVKPTVGVPLFLSGVAIGSFAVHVAVLTNTGWVSDFLSGKELGSTMAELQDQKLDAVKAASIEADGSVTVVLPDGTTARAILEQPVTMASADTVKSTLD